MTKRPVTHFRKTRGRKVIKFTFGKIKRKLINPKMVEKSAAFWVPRFIISD